VPFDTRAELAKLAGVGERTYDKGDKILTSGNEEIDMKSLFCDDYLA
jgi:hypothetical protein